MPVKFDFCFRSRIFHKHWTKLSLHTFSHEFSCSTNVTFNINEVVIITTLNSSNTFLVKTSSKNVIEVQFEKTIAIWTNNIIWLLCFTFSNKNTSKIQRPDFSTVSYSIYLIEVFIISYKSCSVCVDSNIVII